MFLLELSSIILFVVLSLCIFIIFFFNLFYFFILATILVIITFLFSSSSFSSASSRRARPSALSTRRAAPPSRRRRPSLSLPLRYCPRLCQSLPFTFELRAGGNEGHLRRRRLPERGAFRPRSLLWADSSSCGRDEDETRGDEKGREEIPGGEEARRRLNFLSSQKRQCCSRTCS